MITADELRVLNHIVEDMEDHPECNQLSPEEMINILEAYNQVANRESTGHAVRSFESVPFTVSMPQKR